MSTHDTMKKVRDSYTVEYKDISPELQQKMDEENNEMFACAIYEYVCKYCTFNASLHEDPYCTAPNKCLSDEAIEMIRNHYNKQ